MDDKKLKAFVQWLPTKFKEFQDKTPDEIAQSLNDLYSKGEEGKAALQSLWQTFEEEATTNTNMFKAGGKLKALVQKMSKGGRTTRKCACGCGLILKKAKGGTIEECACGCKMAQQKAKQVESYQDGGTPTQQASRAGRKFGAPYQTTGAKDGNKTWQTIKNQGIPAADTTLVSSRGNSFSPQQTSTWTNKFNQLFGIQPIHNMKK